MEAGNATAPKTKGGHVHGRTKLITHKMEMSIPHRDRAEVSKKSDIWKAEAGHRCDTEEAVRVQACGNHRSACDAGSYPHTTVDTA